MTKCYTVMQIINFFHQTFHEYCKQECIPVGCVPPACCPYLPACTAPRGGRGVYLGTCPGEGVYLLGGVCTCLGVYLPRGVYPPGGVPAQGSGGVSAQGGTCPGTPPCEQNSWHTQLKILPCPKLRLRALIIKIYTLAWEKCVPSAKCSARKSNIKSIIVWWKISLSMQSMLQKPISGNQMYRICLRLVHISGVRIT